MEKGISSTVAMRAIEVAEKHLGTDDLAARIGAPASTVRAWRMGHATMPERKYLKLVDLLAELEPQWDKPES